MLRMTDGGKNATRQLDGANFSRHQILNERNIRAFLQSFQSQLLQTGKQCEAVWWLALGNMLFCRKFENCAIFPPFLGIFQGKKRVYFCFISLRYRLFSDFHSSQHKCLATGSKPCNVIQYHVILCNTIQYFFRIVCKIFGEIMQVSTGDSLENKNIQGGVSCDSCAILLLKA